MSDSIPTPEALPQSEVITPFLEPEVPPPADNDHIAPGSERFPEPPVEQAAADVAPTVPPPVVSDLAAGAETPAAPTPPGDEQPAAAPQPEGAQGVTIEGESKPLDGTEVGNTVLIETQQDALAVLGETSGLTAESVPPLTPDPFPEHPMTTLERMRARLQHMGQEVHDDFKKDMEYLQNFFHTFL